jgi:tripartite ATP-independent transporter DctM subunit
MSLGKLEQIQSGVEKVFGGLSAAVITFIMLLTTVDVILRYVFNSPLPGAYTLCEMLMVAAVYPAVAYVQQQKGHVRVDIIIDRLKGSPRISFELATLLLALVAFGIMCWQSGILAWGAWVSGDYDMGEIHYPFWPAKTVMTLGVGLLCLRFITDIKNYFLELKKSSEKWVFWLLLSFLPLLAFSIFFLLISPGQIEPITIGWLMLAAMTVVLFMGLPIAFGLLFIGILGYWVLAGPAKTLSVLGIIPYDKVSNYTLSVVPLFILMGHLAYQAGFATSMYNTCQKWLGHLPGSMAQATVVGGAAFGAACGAGVASCATLAKICIPIMRKHGIDDKMALGCVGAVGGLAALIPPSVMMVIFAMITYQSAAKLLIAGVIPGLLAAACFMVLIYVMVKLNPKLAPPLTIKYTWKERFLSLKDSWGIAILGATIIGGILTGVFTPTEAGDLGTAGAFFLGLITRRLTFKNFQEAILDSTKTTAMIFLIIATALVLCNFLGISRLPAVSSDYIMNLLVPRVLILTGVVILYIIAGCFMDMTSFMLLTMPIIFPTMMALGYDPLWFGVIIVVLCELALITPPFGYNLFILRAMVPGISMGDVIRGSFPFMITYVGVVIILTFFPALATWLPSFM